MLLKTFSIKKMLFKKSQKIFLKVKTQKREKHFVNKSPKSEKLNH